MNTSPYFNPYEPISIHGNSLPHWQQSEKIIFVTWRLADSLPQELLNKWSLQHLQWMKVHPFPWDENTASEYYEQFAERLEYSLDQGMGACCLRNPQHAEIMRSALLHFNGIRYDLHSFVIMPNHVHIIFSLRKGEVMQKIIQSWKRWTARKISQTTGTCGTLWQRGYWDRIVRSPVHLHKCHQYILNNPPNANLRDDEYILWSSSGD